MRIDGKDLILQIRDPNLFNAIRDGLEDTGGFIDLSMNLNLLRVDGTALILLLNCIAEEENAVEAMIEELKGQLPHDSKIDEQVESIFSVSDNLLDILGAVTAIVGELPVVGSTLSIGRAVLAIGRAVNNIVKERRK